MSHLVFIPLLVMTLCVTTVYPGDFHGHFRNHHDNSGNRNFRSDKFDYRLTPLNPCVDLESADPSGFMWFFGLVGQTLYMPWGNRRLFYIMAQIFLNRPAESLRELMEMRLTITYNPDYTVTYRGYGREAVFDCDVNPDRVNEGYCTANQTASTLGVNMTLLSTAQVWVMYQNNETQTVMAVICGSNAEQGEFAMWDVYSKYPMVEHTDWVEIKEVVEDLDLSLI